MSLMLCIFILLVLSLTWVEYNQNRNLQCVFKPLAAAGFILIALFSGAIYSTYGQWILAGLIVCAVGDVLLLSRKSPMKFKLGMAAFAFGHIFYTIAFFTHPEFHYSGLEYGFALLPLVAGLIYFKWIKPRLPADFVIPVAVYSLIIISMVIAAIGVPILWVLGAATLFAISDMFVARDRFVKEEGLNALAITPLYFGAQALFALSTDIAF